MGVWVWVRGEGGVCELREGWDSVWGRGRGRWRWECVN